MPEKTPAATSPDPSLSPRHRALAVLCMTDPREKAGAARALYRETLALPDAALRAEEAIEGGPAQVIPGRPARPELVAPQYVGRRRSLQTLAGRANMIHALCHIEFNAINLALDAAWRFAGMPPRYYRDWLRVADEEALHFTLLADHLGTLGADYGDFPAHNSLWEMTGKTAGDVLARMALVPRTLEARGLDASPPVRARLANVGDHAAAAIIDIILRDEVGHVAIGNHWYRWLCAQRGLDPVTTYAQLAQQYGAPKLRGPFNLDARRAAGFEEDELAWLEASAG
ncbi:ferritin-like domain-containing protein [Cupriavidus consociatus]|uniref:ferritin-like domain-containing protein n=1 Tax=Cupriavidus consociatus TaxID=2821357 RepID=UPI001AE60A3F|nr:MULTISPECIES: ferritin-like domain-containing protein [unclassified Cupriavidus]MBP0620354.1 ferritin-like domain-containing protein [Cupriavidus sp. LEh25]MDK2657010.1 ferritin-like domain-containing protein [Cupriavidus sp. LEh21]